jgi:hypothetical protein
MAINPKLEIVIGARSPGAKNMATIHRSAMRATAPHCTGNHDERRIRRASISIRRTDLPLQERLHPVRTGSDL